MAGAARGAAKRVVEAVHVCECPHIECVVCGNVENRDRPKSTWIRVNVEVTAPDGTANGEEGLVCRPKCQQLWSKGVAERLGLEQPRGRRPRKAQK